MLRAFDLTLNSGQNCSLWSEFLELLVCYWTSHWQSMVPIWQILSSFPKEENYFQDDSQRETAPPDEQRNSKETSVWFSAFATIKSHFLLKTVIMKRKKKKSQSFSVWTLFLGRGIWEKKSPLTNLMWTPWGKFQLDVQRENNFVVLFPKAFSALGEM